MNNRTSSITRKTRETSTELLLALDEPSEPDIDTGLGFLDHMLAALATHARFGLTLRCEGDLRVDDHHTAEDCALALGCALDEALGDRKGILRFSDAHAPMGEALARAAVDLSGRPHATVNLGLRRDTIGALACENIAHVFVSLANTARMTLHVDVLRGENDHHKAEAAFKALALALRRAVAIDPSSSEIPSTKGTLS